MRTLSALILALFITAVPKIATAKEHVEVEATFRNYPAESLAAVLVPLSSKAKLAVVDDGRATIYFNAEPWEVARILKQIASELPKGLLIVRIARVQGEIPTEPKPLDCKRAHIELNNEKAGRFGISLNQLNSYLQSLKDEATDAELAEKVNHGSITDPDGRKIPAKDLLTVTMINVKRPIIVK